MSRPSREALSRAAQTRLRTAIGRLVWGAALSGLLWSTFAGRSFEPWQIAVGLVGAAGCAAEGLAFVRTTLEHRLWPSLGLLVLLVAAAFKAQWAGAGPLAVVLWCGCAVMALERLLAKRGACWSSGSLRQSSVTKSCRGWSPHAP